MPYTPQHVFADHEARVASLMAQLAEARANEQTRVNEVAMLQDKRIAEEIGRAATRRALNKQPAIPYGTKITKDAGDGVGRERARSNRPVAQS